MRLISLLFLALVSCLHADPTAVSGSLTATGQILNLSVSNNNTWGVQVTGTWSGSLVVEGTINQTGASATGYTALPIYTDPGAVISTSITANGVYYGTMPGKARLRLRASSIASGTASCTLLLADSVSGVPVSASFASGYVGVSCIAGCTSSIAYNGVSVVTSVLPTGAATDATLQNIQSAFSNVTVNTHAVTITDASGNSVFTNLLGGTASLFTQASQRGLKVHATLNAVDALGNVAPLNSVRWSEQEDSYSFRHLGVAAVAEGTDATGTAPQRIRSIIDANGVTRMAVNSLQGGPLTVSGSVSVSALPAAYSGVSVVGTVALSSAYVGVTLAAQTQTITVAGTVTTVGGVYDGVSVVSSVLPAGASTESTLLSVSGSVASLAARGTALNPVTVSSNITAINGTALSATLGGSSSVSSNLVGVPVIAAQYAYDLNAATTRRVQMSELNGASQGSTTLGFSDRAQGMGWNGSNLVPITAVSGPDGVTRWATSLGGAYLGVSVQTSVLPTGAATDATALSISGSAASIALGIPVSVTRSVAMGGSTGVSLSAYFWNTFTAAPQNGSFVAGTNGPFMVTLCPNFGGATIKSVFGNTTYTPDSLLVSRMGEPLATSSTCLTYGPFNAGMQVSVMATGATGVSGTATFYTVK